VTAPRLRQGPADDNLNGTRHVLAAPDTAPYLSGMRAAVALFMLALVTQAVAQPAKKPAKPARPSAEPTELGKFDDWIAATHQESGHTVCYAFVPAKTSVPTLPRRGEVILTVTERPGPTRDWVAISAGFPYRKDATVSVQVDTTGLDFYTGQSSAFARDGRAAVAAFHRGQLALARSPGPQDGQVVDTFSLRGFAAAYAAITKACPAK